mgnify:CR=1 FL=1
MRTIYFEKIRTINHILGFGKDEYSKIIQITCVFKDNGDTYYLKDGKKLLLNGVKTKLDICSVNIRENCSGLKSKSDARVYIREHDGNLTIYGYVFVKDELFLELWKTTSLTKQLRTIVLSKDEKIMDEHYEVIPLVLSQTDYTIYFDGCRFEFSVKEEKEYAEKKLEDDEKDDDF